MKRVDELDSPLNTTTELEAYAKKLRELYRDLYMELEMAAEVLQQNLATLPVAQSKMGGPLGTMNSRMRARLVARNLRRAAEASKFAGGQGVKMWRDFVKVFAPEIDAARNRRRQPKFNVDK